LLRTTNKYDEVLCSGMEVLQRLPVASMLNGFARGTTNSPSFPTTGPSCKTRDANVRKFVMELHDIRRAGILVSWERNIVGFWSTDLKYIATMGADNTHWEESET
jgi:hypothetical protein